MSRIDRLVTEVRDWRKQNGEGLRKTPHINLDLTCMHLYVLHIYVAPHMQKKDFTLGRIVSCINPHALFCLLLILEKSAYWICTLQS